MTGRFEACSSGTKHEDVLRCQHRNQEPESALEFLAGIDSLGEIRNIDDVRLRLATGEVKLQGAKQDKQGAKQDKQGAKQDKQGAKQDKQGAKQDKQGAKQDKQGASERIVVAILSPAKAVGPECGPRSDATSWVAMAFTMRLPEHV